MPWIPLNSAVGWEDPLEKERLPTPVFWPGEPMDCIVHGVAKSRTQLSNFHFKGKENIYIIVQ